MDINSFIHKLFERASEAGYEASEAYYSTGEQFDVSVKGGSIIDYSVSSSIGLSFRALVDGVIAAYMYIGFDGDPAYPEIKGAWKHDGPYAVVHRIAIAPEFRGLGLGSVTFRLVEEFCKGKGFDLLRIDTDGANKRMQHVLEKNGFVYCGTVIQGGGDRFAYEKKL